MGFNVSGPPWVVSLDSWQTAAQALVSAPGIPGNDLLTAVRKPVAGANGLPGTAGATVMAWAGAGTASDAGRAIKSTYNRTSLTNVLGQSPDKASPNVIRLSGNSAGTAVHWQEALTTPFVDNTARNIGLWVRALPRTDGISDTMVRLILARDAAGSMDFSNPFGDWIFRAQADGEWRFHVLTCTATAGHFKSSSSPAVFIPGTAVSLAWARVQLPATAETYELPVCPDSNFVEFGPITLNPRGAKAAAVIRFDDCKKTALLPTNSGQGYGAFSSFFPGGFVGRSGVNISAAAGDAMSIIDLVEAFGFKSTHYILCRHVGQQVGFDTLEDLRGLQRRGHLVAFQSNFNPTSSDQRGVRLLGPSGFTMAAAGAITGIAGAVLTHAGHIVDAATTRPLVTGVQGCPVVFNVGGLPTTITAGVEYWLRYISTTTYSVHPSELDAQANTNAINFSTGTAASISYRFSRSTNDSSAILADYQAGKSFFQANNLGDGYKCYALNQSAHDRHVALAMLAFGEFWPALGGSVADDVMALTHASYQSSRFTLDARMPSRLMMAEAAISTDDVTVEATVREFVRLGVQEGAVIQNIGHDQRASAMTWYLDELKFWSDAGLVYVDTHDNVARALAVGRIGAY